MTHNKIKRMYGTWINIIYRCTNKTTLEFKSYGGRGIKVCDRWLDPFKLKRVGCHGSVPAQGFLNFLEDMGATWWLTRSENTRRSVNQRYANGTHRFSKDQPTRGTVWITDGVVNKRLILDYPIPDGYRKGMTKHVRKNGTL
jgi:hypothetical protein